MEDIRKIKVGMSLADKQGQAQQIKAQVLKEVAGGSPKETFQTRESLERKYPTGADGVFLVIKNSDNKAHWFYWNTSVWSDGGVYISADLDDYAKIDGSYDLMEVGSAKQVVNPYGNPIDKSVFVQRETYNGAEFTNGIAKVHKIKGKIIKNNICENFNFVNFEQWKGAYEFINNLIPNSTYTINFKTKNTDAGLYFNERIFTQVNSFKSDGKEHTYVVKTRPDMFNDSVIIKNNINNIDKVNETTIYDFQIINGDALNDIPPYTPYFNGLKVSAPSVLVSTGRNLWDEKWEQGTINTDGTNVPSDSNVRSKNYIPVAPNSTIYNNVGLAFFFYDINKKYIDRDNDFDMVGLHIPSNCYYIRFRTGDIYGGTYKNDIMLNFGTEPLPYEPYTYSSLDLDKFYESGVFDRHAGYGCAVNEEYYNELDLDNKVLIHRVSDIITLDGSEDESWTKFGNGFKMLTPLENALSTSGGEIAPLIASVLNPTSANEIYSGNSGIAIADGYIWMNNGSTTLEQFKAWLKDNPIQVIYVLAETRTEDVSLLVNNNRYKAIGHGMEYWYQPIMKDALGMYYWFALPVSSSIEYQSDLAGKLAKLRTAPEQADIDTEQDRRIKALEDRIAQLTASINNGGNQQ